MQTGQNKRFLLGFVFGGIFATVFILLFGYEDGKRILEKLLEDENSFEKTFLEKFSLLKSQQKSFLTRSDSLQKSEEILIHPPQVLNDSLENSKLSFTKSIKHHFKKNGKFLSS